MILRSLAAVMSSTRRINSERYFAALNFPI